MVTLFFLYKTKVIYNKKKTIDACVRAKIFCYFENRKTFSLVGFWRCFWLCKTMYLIYNFV